MRGEKIYRILNFLGGTTVNLWDFLDAVLSSGYGASMGKLDREYSKLKKQREYKEYEKEKKRNLEKYIYKLKAQGLIELDASKSIKLTKTGKNKLENIKNTQFLDKNFYESEKGNKVIIVSYDLPVMFNRERDKLRGVLKSLGFNMVHKSVWIGKVKLPAKFILGLNKLHLLSYIEILQVTKQGSLKPL